MAIVTEGKFRVPPSYSPMILLEVATQELTTTKRGRRVKVKLKILVGCFV